VTVLRGGRGVLTVPASSVTAGDLATAMIGESERPRAVRGVARERGGLVVRLVDATVRRPDGRTTLQNATFDVHEGEIVGVAGVEGSGSYDLLRVAAGRLAPTTGTVIFPERTSFVPEDRHREAVVLDFNLAENVAIYGAGRRTGLMHWPTVRSRTAEVLRAFDVRARGPDDLMRTLSGGNQQRVVLGRELLTEPDALVVENPTRGLDLRASLFIRERIRAARDAGMAVVFYSSDLDEVVEMADRVLVTYAAAVRPVRRERAAIGAAMVGAA
jgi:ABC-type uncharacterized transport system ATPase subunit